MVADEVEHNNPVDRTKTLDLGSLESFKFDLGIAHSLFPHGQISEHDRELTLISQGVHVSPIC